MNKLDKEIRKLAKQSKCSVRKEYEEGIDRLLENMKEQSSTTGEGKVRRISTFRLGFAACALVGVMCVSIPVAAKISDYVTERMTKMSQEEQENYEKMHNNEYLTNEHDTEAIRYSRELSEEERGRFRQLSAKYEEEGLFPEEEIQIVDKLEEDVEITSLIYEIYNRELYLPERQLTDEELLQIADLFHKESYSVSQSEEAKKEIERQRAFEENSTPGENTMTQEEAITKASAYLRGMFEVDTAVMDKTAQYWLGLGYEGGYDYEVTFKNGAGESYRVDMNAETGTLYDMEKKTSLLTLTEPTAVDEKLLASNYEKVKNICIGVLGTDIEIVSGSCVYPVDEDGSIPTGNVGLATYMLELSNGAAYYMQYDIVNETFNAMVYAYDYAGEKKMQEEGVIERNGNKVITMIAGNRMAVLNME